MAAFKAFDEIGVWKEARKLVNEIYSLTCREPFCRDFGMRDQIQRAAVSICSNVAEGFERRGNKEFINFLWIAKGSAAEVASQLYHANDLGYVNEHQFAACSAHAKKISAMIYKLISSISDPSRTKLPHP